jgi:hypothetical protein
MNSTSFSIATTRLALFTLALIVLACPPLRAQGSSFGLPAQSAGASVKFEGVPASFTVPMGWKVLEREGDVTILVPNTSQPELLVAAIGTTYSNLEDFYKKAGETIEEDLQVANARVLEAPRAFKVNGMTASTAVVAAENPNGEPVKIGLHVVLSGDGVGIGVLTVASVPTFAQGAAAAQQILDSGRFGALTQERRTTTTAGLTGRWVRSGAANGGNRNSSSGGWSSGSNVSYTFYENGTYSYFYESFAAIDVPGLGGLSSSEDRDSGRYYVADGKLTLVSEKEGTSTLSFRQVDGKYIQIGNFYYARQ